MLKVIHKIKNNHWNIGKPTPTSRSGRSGALLRTPSASAQVLGPSLRGWSRFLCPACSILGLAGLVVVSGSVHAETLSAYQLNANVAEAGLSVDLSSSSGTLNLAPPYSGTAQDSTKVSVTVSTHNGYQLFMVNESDDDGNHPLTDNTSGNTLPTLGSTCNSGCNISGDSFTTNAWGFNAGARNAANESTTYRGFPSNVAYYRIGGYAGEVADSYVLNFGAKVDYNQDPGTYTSTINFIAVADSTRLYMQFMQASDCTTTAKPVYDSRDNSSYTIQRLADGKCWMLDNLALDPTNSNVKAVMNELNTNASAASLAAFKNGGGSGPLATAGVTGTWGKNELNQEGGSVTPGGSYHPAGWTDNWTVPRVNTAYISTIPGGHTNADVNSSINNTEKVGVYYNYCAASAGSYCYAATAGAGNASEDICPAGWRLPTGGSSGEFNALYTATDIASDYAKFVNALQLPLSGSFVDGSMYNQGSGGLWWSSTRGDGSTMYTLRVNKSNVYPAGYFHRWYGFTIRCVLQ